MFVAKDDLRELVEETTTLAERKFTDRACSWHGEFPWENVERLAEQGLVGVNLPEEYGGRGLGEFEAMAVIEAVGRVCPDTANALYVSSMVSPRAIDMFGSEAAKEKYLPPVCAGEASFSIAISEPHAGSDAGAMDTKVTESGGKLTISGEFFVHTIGSSCPQYKHFTAAVRAAFHWFSSAVRTAPDHRQRTHSQGITNSETSSAQFKTISRHRYAGLTDAGFMNDYFHRMPDSLGARARDFRGHWRDPEIETHRVHDVITLPTASVEFSS